MTYIIPNTDDKYLIDDQGLVFSIKSNKFMNIQAGYVHLTINGWRNAMSVKNLLDDIHTYPYKYKLFSQNDLKNIEHIYIFDFSVGAIYHGVLDNTSQEDYIENYLSKYKLKDSQISYMVTKYQTNIQDL